MIEGTSGDWAQLAMQIAQARRQKMAAEQQLQSSNMLARLLSMPMGSGGGIQIQPRPKKQRQGMSLPMGGQQQQLTRGSTGGVSLSDTVRSGSGGSGLGAVGM